MKTKRKNSDQSSFPFALQCLFVAMTPIIVVILCSVLFTSLFPIKSADVYDESLTIFVNGNTVAIQNEYSGYVSISVKGVVEKDRTFYQDSHFIKDIFTGKRQYFDGFYIDGIGNRERLRFSVFPEHDTNGEYEFRHYIGDIPRQITFQIVNGHVHDDVAFEVKVAEGNVIHIGR